MGLKVSSIRKLTASAAGPAAGGRAAGAGGGCGAGAGDRAGADALRRREQPQSGQDRAQVLGGLSGPAPPWPGRASGAAGRRGVIRDRVAPGISLARGARGGLRGPAGAVAGRGTTDGDAGGGAGGAGRDWPVAAGGTIPGVAAGEGKAAVTSRQEPGVGQVFCFLGTPLRNEANRRACCWGSHYETKPTAAPAAGGPTTKRSQPPCPLLGALARKNLSSVAQFLVRAKRPA